MSSLIMENEILNRVKGLEVGVLRATRRAELKPEIQEDVRIQETPFPTTRKHPWGASSSSPPRLSPLYRRKGVHSLSSNPIPTSIQ